MSALIGLVVGLPLLPVAAVTSPWATLLLGASILSAAAILTFVRVTKQTRLASHLVIGLVFVDVGIGMAVAGGVASPNRAWLLVIPLAASLLLGFRASLGWAVACGVLRVGLWAVERGGVALPNVMLPPLRDSVAVVLDLFALLVVVGLTRAFARVHEDLLRTIQQSRDKIRELAHIDPVTGLPNRLYFQDRLRAAVSLAHRHQRRVALMFLDLDGFKQINDTLGHEAGDALLREVGRRLRRCVRATDAVARETGDDEGWGGVDSVSRLGGDEFTVLLSEIRDESNAAQVAERVLAALREPVNIEGGPVSTLASIGIALFPRDASDADSLLRHADLAMYEAKARGRDCLQFFSEEMNEELQERAALGARLRAAVAGEAFVHHFHCVRSLSSGRLVRAEVRRAWVAPDLAEADPERLETAIRSSGLARRLWQGALESACAHLVEWKRRGLRPVTLCLDVSESQLRSYDTVERIGRALDEHGLDPSLLEVEIPEQATAGDDAGTVETLAGLEALGVRFAVDHFGTGASSLAHLSRWPAGRLKIGADIVHDLGNGRNADALARTIIAVAHNLEMQVVATDVRSEEEVERLRALGCDEIQGPLVCPGLGAREFGRLLATEKDSDDAGPAL